MQYTVSKQDKKLEGTITLEGSKSISNRALIIRALCQENFELENLSEAKDTQTLLRLLERNAVYLDAGPAGTTFRFLTAYLALQGGSQELTGSDRMKERPIGILVDALRELGANIDYLGKKGYPPLKIKSPTNLGENNKISIAANVSSQFISALLMIGPCLPNGLELTLVGRIVSRPYIQMTLSVMRYFGLRATWNGQTIAVPRGQYQARPLTIEADWSAASYYYEMAAIADEVDLKLMGLFAESLQGDSVLVEMMEFFGIETQFIKGGIHLSKTKPVGNLFEWDFMECPDLAQALAATCAGTGIMGILRGLETLYIKETNRVAALEGELSKTGVTFKEMPAASQAHEYDHAHSCMGKANVKKEVPVFDTYHDHRMAMCLAPLAMSLGTVKINDPTVVEKSYPSFWDDLRKIGFEINSGVDFSR